MGCLRRKYRRKVNERLKGNYPTLGFSVFASGVLFCLCHLQNSSNLVIVISLETLVTFLNVNRIDYTNTKF